LRKKGEGEAWPHFVGAESCHICIPRIACFKLPINLMFMFIGPCIIFIFEKIDQLGWGGLVGFSLHPDTTPPQPNHNVTPTHIEPEQYNP